MDVARTAVTVNMVLDNTYKHTANHFLNPYSRGEAFGGFRGCWVYCSVLRCITYAKNWQSGFVNEINQKKKIQKKNTKII